MEQGKTNENFVFIGGKPFMNYVNAVAMQFTIKNASEVIIKSRGKFISMAVDVAEVVKNRMLGGMGLKYNGIKIDSESFKDKDGRDVRVSSMEITLVKSQ